MQEIEILDWIHGTFGCSAMDLLAMTFEYVFKYDIIWLVLCVVMMCTKRYRTFGSVLLTAMLFQICMVYCLKFGIDRPRPFEEYSVPALITSFSSSSFPSGHAASLFCAATVSAAFDRESALPMFVLAILVSFTRLYIYAHYPTDVLAGACIGIFCGLFALFTVMRLNPRTVYVQTGGPDDGTEQ